MTESTSTRIAAAAPCLATYPTRAEAIAALGPLFRSGLSLREVAERLGAHPRAVAALLSGGNCRAS